MCQHQIACVDPIDTNNTQGMQLGRFKNRTPARFEYILYITDIEPRDSISVRECVHEDILESMES
jgi:hypothetical protein